MYFVSFLLCQDFLFKPFSCTVIRDNIQNGKATSFRILSRLFAAREK